MADGDLGNVYRDDLTLADYRDYLDEAVRTGKLTEDQAEDLQTGQFSRSTESLHRKTRTVASWLSVRLESTTSSLIVRIKA